MSMGLWLAEFPQGGNVFAPGDHHQPEALELCLYGVERKIADFRVKDYLIPVCLLFCIYRGH